MTTRTYTDEKRWANTDPSLHFNHGEPKVPDWRQEYIRLLKINPVKSLTTTQRAGTFRGTEG